MTRKIISLNDNQWHFGQVRQRPFSTANLLDLPAVDPWLPATVPGNVRLDLLALNHIPDPFVAEGYKDSLWVEGLDWWYRRVVNVNPLLPQQRAFVRFKGIDYLSAIFIDDREVTRHQGMFSPQIVEFTAALQRSSSPVEIAVRVWGSNALPRRRLTRVQKIWQKFAGTLYRSWAGIYPDRSATLKCQMSFGWDFAPPLRTMGIWDNVDLLIIESVFIEELAVSSQPLAVGGLWSLAAKLSLNTPNSRAVNARVSIEPANFDGPAIEPFHFSLQLPAGHSTVNLRCTLPQVALWQPWDRGFPHLYNITATLFNADGKSLDTITRRTGFRTVHLPPFTSPPPPPGSSAPWQYSINGQPEFIRGLNWVPADSFPGRLRRDDYARLLQMARDSGANFLRVWGGGLREKKAFYDLCDELGLLVWQEFPFACMFLGSFPRDAAYLELVEQECSAIVRQLRHHPALIHWCGGNEFSRRRNRPLLNTLTRGVRQHDGARPFTPTSPTPAHGGDAHNWHVWHGEAPIQAYRQETARFLSEFGLQAVSSINNYQLTMNNSYVGYADIPKLERYSSLFDKQLATPDSSFSVQRSQLAQAVGLQTAIEHMRRRKGEAGGVCLWQFNEPWPAVSWAIVDYFGRPKLAYKQLSTWYNPLLISLDFPVGQKWAAGDTFTAQIWAINDSLSSYTGCALKITLSSNHNSQSETIHVLQLPPILPNSVRPVGAIAHRLTTPPHSIEIKLQHKNKVLCQNSYPLNWRDAGHSSLVLRLRRGVVDWVLR